MAMAICVLYGPARTSSCALPGAGAAVPADTVALTILYPGAARGAQNFAILGGNFSRSWSNPNKILSKFYANLSKSTQITLIPTKFSDQNWVAIAPFDTDQPPL